MERWVERNGEFLLFCCESSLCIFIRQEKNVILFVCLFAAQKNNWNLIWEDGRFRMKKKVGIWGFVCLFPLTHSGFSALCCCFYFFDDWKKAMAKSRCDGISSGRWWNWGGGGMEYSVVYDHIFVWIVLSSLLSIVYFI